MIESEFEKDLQINPNQLDLEACMQGELFFKWAKKSVKANGRRDDCKLRLEVVTADLSNKARLDPDSFGIQRITEASITTAVKSSPEFLEAYENWVKAKMEADLVDKAVASMEQRKRMLELLVTLHGQEYFAGPSVPRNLIDAWKEAKKSKAEELLRRTKVRKRH